jgi:hypothetical protein
MELILTPWPCPLSPAWMRMRGWPIRALDNVAPNGHPPRLPVSIKRCRLWASRDVFEDPEPSLQPSDRTKLPPRSRLSHPAPLPPASNPPCWCRAPPYHVSFHAQHAPFRYESPARTPYGYNAITPANNDIGHSARPVSTALRLRPAYPASIELHPGTRQTSTDEPMRQKAPQTLGKPGSRAGACRCR